MQKKLFLLLLCFGASTFVIAQSLDRSVLSSDGASSKTANISLDWTLGQLATATASTSHGMLTQGFHQASLTIEENTFEEEMCTLYEDFHLQIAPNPVKAILTAKVETQRTDKVKLTLLDQNGKPLQQQSFSAPVDKTEFDLSAYPSGLYLLHFATENGALIKTFKVTKVN